MKKYEKPKVITPEEAAKIVMNEKQNDDGTWSEAEPIRASWEKKFDEEINKKLTVRIILFVVLLLFLIFQIIFRFK